MKILLDGKTEIKEARSISFTVSDNIFAIKQALRQLAENTLFCK